MKHNFLYLLRCEIERRGIVILRIAVGSVFVWFGVLKFFGSSDAEDIAAKTISTLSGGLIEDHISLPLLAAVECAIGISILFKRWLNVMLPVMYLQMLGTLTPLALFPGETWQDVFVPTLTGQYIIKNAVIIAAGIVIGVTARGGKLIADPEVAERAKKEEKKKLDDQA